MQTRDDPALSPPSPGKRTYLALLQPSQIIDICLAFDPYVPSHVKSSVWPVDLNAAIAALQAKPASSKPGHTSRSPPPKGEEQTQAVMASLLDRSTASSRSPRVKSPDHQPSTSSDSKPASGAQSANPHSTPGFPYHLLQASYPHAPYYSPQGVPSSHSTYSSFPQNPHAQISPINAALPNLPNPLPPDDLPSYEEMIVEALKSIADSDGAAPKDLFSWMASHYPLQTNFRPSASQALQKAFKRGRLSKSTNGRYTLNPSWEGGSTSRRTTRRPQTQSQAIVSPPTKSQPPSQPFQHVPTPTTASPFTHTPLHRHPVIGGPSTPGQPPYLYLPYPYYPQPPPALPADHEISQGSDSWKAAQNILKAMDLDGVVKSDAGAAGPSHGDGRGELQVHLALLAAQLIGIAQAKEASMDYSNAVDGEDNDTDKEDDPPPSATTSRTRR